MAQAGSTTPPQRRYNADFLSVPFTPLSLDMFFALLESAFDIEGITDEAVKYHILARDVMPHEIGDAARDLITSKPTEMPYTSLKNVLLQTLKPKSFTASVEKMQALQMGTLRPSEFLNRLRNCANDELRTNPIFIEELTKCWRNALPAGWHPALILASDLTKAAEAADALYDAYGAAMPSQAASAPATVSVAAVQKPKSLEARVALIEENIAKLLNLMEKDERGRQPDRGRSRSLNARLVQTDLCFYHDRFAKKARRCVNGCRHFQQFMKSRAENDKLENEKGAQQ
ncbi:uncharacterized protein LOC135938356 [Cloeon dipterum]|uniref:uncharacterized protein LOC135938356 n=1 Tax=Cloeon dipterum TaxID=197152 RepID=UPI00322002AD